MRLVTKRSIECLLAGKNYSSKNTRVVGDKLILWNTPIIEVREDGVYISTGGWDTVTTKERLNGLPGVSVYHRKHVLHLNGVPWDGNWCKVDVDIY
jgi:hypothetical protein